MRLRGASKATTLVAVTLLVQYPGHAAEWDSGAGISVGSYYSDNICRAPFDEQGKWVGTVRPDVSIRGRGARGNVRLEGGVEYNTLADSSLDCSIGDAPRDLSNRASFIPSLRFSSDYELLQDWLTLEAQASARRTSINPFAAGADDPLSGRDNTNLIYDYSVGAFVQRRIAQYAELRARYSYNEQFNEAAQFGDSSENRLEVDLDTLPGSSRLSYGVGGRYSKVEYDEAENRPAFDNELASAELRAGFQLNSSWQITGLAGEEWNEFTSASDDIDGFYWDAGVRWTPNPRVEVNVGTGERFFGSTPRASIAYRHKRSELRASYQRSLELPRNLRVRDAAFFAPEELFDPDFGGVPGDPLGSGGVPTILGQSPTLDERVQLGYVFTGRRTTIELSASESRQTRVEDEGEGIFRQAGLTMSRDLSSVLSTSLRISWEEGEGSEENQSFFARDREVWRATLGFTRQVGQSTSLTVAFQHTTQDSDSFFNSYDENRLTFSVRHGF